MFLKGIKCYEKAAKIAFEEESTELLLEIRMEADYVA
jgi:hypothetical protein